jgi:hypothetical protein
MQPHFPVETLKIVLPLRAYPGQRRLHSFFKLKASRHLVRTAYARKVHAAAAVDDCLAQLADVDPLFLIVFCGGKHAGPEVQARLHARYPLVPITGGSAAGVIGRASYGYSGLELGLVAITDARAVPELYVNADLLAGEYDAGMATGRDVAARAADGAVVLLLFDSVATGAPPRLHYASSIMAGFQAGAAGKRLRVVGGGLLTDLNLTDGWVMDSAGVHKHVVQALIFPPAIRADTVVCHGCRPVSTFMRITRLDGARVFELDGEPALTVIERMLGLPLGGTEGHELTMIATLGQKQGDPFGPYNENDYVNRLILTADRAAGSITLFEPDFTEGAMVQIMARDNALMLDSVRDGVAAANRSAASGEAILNLYIDCAGRVSARTGAPREEAEVVMESIAPQVPFMGFFSGVEIAPFGDGSRPLDWTGVLVTLRYAA